MSSSCAEAVERLRKTFQSGKTQPLAYRLAQLQRMKVMLDENADQLCEAVYRDLRKVFVCQLLQGSQRCSPPKLEAFCFEIQAVLNEIEVATKCLKSWSAPSRVSRNLLQLLDSAFITKQPLGVVLIISAWNYPINLLLVPLVGALAAGNCVMLKPSEVAGHSARLMDKLISTYFEKDTVTVFLGEVEETIALLRERFDHIFFTGSSSVGSMVMRAASEHLTPVTLELGGKCPVIVDSLSDIQVAAKRIVWGKYIGCGQTCIAPDYLLCDWKTKEELVDCMAHQIRNFYGDNPQKSPDYGRIVNSVHLDRLIRLIEKSNVIIGGRHDRDDLYLEPTIVSATLSDEILQDEIFGPILPVVGVDNMENALHIVMEREHPLAIYLFTRNPSLQQKFIECSHSGALVVNDVMVHTALDTLPFGGVGRSGMGRYHGKFSFDTFSHEKSVLKRPEYGEKLLWMRYPPFDESKFYWMKTVFKTRPLSHMNIVLAASKIGSLVEQ
ncbi:Aldedh domain containing protein [Trichuris trichiura]|uniref:Aldehyde dehydrogenase n=1 Tax=Trichuris trichiura TaxID=36087 RepID=A0A077ZKY4_TRITR|nr:Aldedh domain containing protein [Trichuris trichiura]